MLNIDPNGHYRAQNGDGNFHLADERLLNLLAGWLARHKIWSNRPLPLHMNKLHRKLVTKTLLP
jgi:hypothetical protein